MRVPLVIICLWISTICLGAEQRATITRFEVHLSKAVTGAAMYEFSGTVHFELSADDFKKTGDSSIKIYAVDIRFKEFNKPVLANTEFATELGDKTGALLLGKYQELEVPDGHNYDFSFCIPNAAFDLKEGKHELMPIINVTGPHALDSVLGKEKIAPVSIKILPTTKIRVWVKHILVDSLDADGRLWDYFIANPIDGNPDIKWSLNYAGLTYHSSKMRKNVFEYFDYDKTEAFDFRITKGDTISIEVKDVDVLTPDDIIGTVIVAPANQTGELVTAKAGQVKRLEYSISVLT